MRKQNKRRHHARRSTITPSIEGVKSQTPAEVLSNLDSVLDEHDGAHSMYFWKGPAAINSDPADSLQ